MEPPGNSPGGFFVNSMIPRDIFYARLERCKACSEWDGVCLRGHGLQSPEGCPLRKFKPIQASDYTPDRGRVTHPKSAAKGCSSCRPAVDPAALPAMTWTQVVANFSESVARWAKAGMPVASSAEHARRNAICHGCDQLRGYHCAICKCVVYAKAGLQTEYCPMGKW